MTDRIRTDRPRPQVARVTLARPEARNAADRQMLAELDAAFADADADGAVNVIVLAADGEDFSSGHDLRDFAFMADQTPEEHRAYEDDEFLQRSWRWRNLRTPTIAAVQGRTIASGLMFVWPCDLIVAAADATFSDPVAGYGVNGHEYFVHAWELGPRKAKELLFRGTPVTAAEAHALGMVNHVVGPGALESFTLDLAEEIAARSPVGVQLAKASVNASVDAQGQWDAVRAAFALHHLGHLSARARHGALLDADGVRAERDRARARKRDP